MIVRSLVRFPVGTDDSFQKNLFVFYIPVTLSVNIRKLVTGNGELLNDCLINWVTRTMSKRSYRPSHQ